MTPSDIDATIRRVYFDLLIVVAPFLLAIGYLMGILFDLRDDQALPTFLVGLAGVGVFVLAVPLWIVNDHIRSAVAVLPSDVPGSRLTRLLTLPRRLELNAMMSVLIGAILLTAYVVFVHGKPAWNLAIVTFLIMSLNMLVGMRFCLRIEAAVRTEAVAEFHRYPAARVTGWWLHWPRLPWYLPYVFVSIMFGSLAFLGTLVVGKGHQALQNMVAELIRTGQPAAADMLSTRAAALVNQIMLPAVLLGLFMMGFAIHTAWQLAKRYSEASIRLKETVEAFAAGAPRLPVWIGTDEFGDLASGLADVLDRLRAMAALLRTSASQLATSAEQLGGSTGEQNATLVRQAAAMQETEVTAQEIRQTSLLAAQKTEAVLKTAERADEISRTGGDAIDKSLVALTDVRGEVSEMASRIRSLGDRARQIATITTTVKDFADQSNMLALNAAIEAMRSGEHGKGFAVVAREIRSLADQSSQATNRVREILDDITDAIQSAVVITQRGSGKVEAGLVQMQSSGESLRELSSIARDNTQAVRQIAAAVSQQNAGIAQIFEAVKDLSRMMDDTMGRLRTTENAATLVRTVAEDVTGIVRSYGVEAAPVEAGAPAGVPVGRAA